MQYRTAASFAAMKDIGGLQDDAAMSCEAHDAEDHAELLQLPSWVACHCLKPMQVLYTQHASLAICNSLVVTGETSSKS